MEQKKNILIVDDEQGWREILTEILQEDGRHIDEATNFNDAVVLFKSKHYDLAILDIRLVDESPYNIDGLRVLKEIKDSDRPMKKAIILTGYPEENQKQRALKDFKADGYYEKAPDGMPFDIEKFKKVVANLLK